MVQWTNAQSTLFTRMMAVSDTFIDCCDFCGNELCSCLDPNMNPDSPDYKKVILSIEEWEHHFKPMVNHLDKNASFDDGNGGIMFETYGAEYDHVAAIGQQDQNRIWTYMDDGDGNTVITNSWSFINRIGYMITEKPYDDNYFVEVQLDKE